MADFTRWVLLLLLADQILKERDIRTPLPLSLLGVALLYLFKPEEVWEEMAEQRRAMGGIWAVGYEGEDEERDRRAAQSLRLFGLLFLGFLLLTLKGPAKNPDEGEK